MSAQILTNLTASAQQVEAALKQQQKQQQQQIANVNAFSNAGNLKRIKCGIIYTWNCIGENYAVECTLCEERPICALHEFAEHMDIWHNSWEESMPAAAAAAATAHEQLNCSNDVVNITDLERSIHDELMAEVLEELKTNGILLPEERSTIPNAQIVESQNVDVDEDIDVVGNVDVDLAGNVNVHVDVENEIELEVVAEETAAAQNTTQLETIGDIGLNGEQAENLLMEKLLDDFQNEMALAPQTVEQQQEQQQITALKQLIAMEIDAPVVDAKAEQDFPVKTADFPITATSENFKFIKKTQSKSENDIFILGNDNILTPRSTPQHAETELKNVQQQYSDSEFEETFFADFTTQQQQQQQQQQVDLIDGSSVLLTPQSLTPARSPAPATTPLNLSGTLQEDDDLTHAQTRQITELDAGQQIDYGLNANVTQASEKKLTSEQIDKLIEFYEAQPRLWNQSHAEFRDTELCRKSWHEITKQWNHYSGRQFTVPDVRIRMSTLCQRFLKQHERLTAEGELDECIKFVHYDKLKFLIEQQTLQNRRAHFERENRKLIEMYAHYPLLWHNSHKHIRCPQQREAAHSGISMALKLCGINLTPFAVQRRIQSLRKCYRLEKIRYLHCMLEGELVQCTTEKDFKTNFVHYHEMAYLHQHIDPYICAGCGKIFENLATYREHVNSMKNDCWEAYQKLQITTNDDDAQDDNNSSSSSSISSSMAQQTAAQQKNETKANIGDTHNDSMEVERENDVMQKINAEQLPNNDANMKSVDTNPTTAAKLPKTKELLVKVQCSKFSYNLRFKANQKQKIQKFDRKKIQTRSSVDSGMDDEDADDDNENQNDNVVEDVETDSGDFVNNDNDNDDYEADADADADAEIDVDVKAMPLFTQRLTPQQTRKLIDLYKAQPTLWDPNHLDYHSRQQRRIAWSALTTELNRSWKVNYAWQAVHRKLTDYAKYYRREKQRIDKFGVNSKWCFYDDFRFLDDALIVSSKMQKSLQHPDNNQRIIELYKSYPQLWCTDHPDYTKRKQRQRHIDALCTRLQEEHNIQMTTERLKQRIIEYRCQYRQAKQQRLHALKKQPGIAWQSDYEYYEALRFLDQHVAPFLCAHCNSSFKRRTDYLRHELAVHSPGNDDDGGARARGRRRRNTDSDNTLDHICHICGMKFTLRNSLLAHLKRHLGQRTHACSICPKKFFNTTSLTVHMRSHTKEQPFVCEICARGFVNGSKLNQHVKRHRNQRDYPCNRCDKAFFSAFERDRHVRSHLNIRDKVCPICGRAFVIGSAYYSHMNLHRDTKRYACENCEKRFAQYAGLYKHRKRCKASEPMSD